MLKVMKLAGMTKKKVEVCNVAARHEERTEEFNHDILSLDTKIYSIL